MGSDLDAAQQVEPTEFGPTLAQEPNSDRLDRLSELPIRVGIDQTWTEATQDLRVDIQRWGANREDTEATRQFNAEWARKTWGHLLGLDRSACKYASSTVMLTFTGRTSLPGCSNPVPPGEHFRRLRDAASARQSALSRALSGVERWQRVGVYGADRDGYVHQHVGLYVSESVSSETFESVMRAHVDNCPVAEWSAHGAGAITVRADPSVNEPSSLIGYLGMNVPSLDARDDRSLGLDDEPDHRRRAAAVLDSLDHRAVQLGFSDDT